MKKFTLTIALVLLLTSCISQKGTELHKGKTALKQVQLLYSDKSKNESINFHKTYTSETSGKEYDVYIVTENGMNTNAKTVAGQILNYTTRYLVFNSENIYVDTIQNPINIQKNINKL
jgi:hypothetical protein